MLLSTPSLTPPPATHLLNALTQWFTYPSLSPTLGPYCESTNTLDTHIVRKQQQDLSHLATSLPRLIGLYLHQHCLHPQLYYWQHMVSCNCWPADDILPAIPPIISPHCSGGLVLSHCATWALTLLALLLA